MHDLLGFRSLLYSILSNHHNLRNLPIEFNIFFSKLFIDGVFPIRRVSFYQLRHPLFYDVDEMRNFLRQFLSLDSTWLLIVILV